MMITKPHQIPRGLPAQAGVSPAAIRQLVETWDALGLGLHSMMLIRHGRVIAESWWAPYQADYPHMLNSLSKSFTSTAVGFAVQDGLLSVEDLVLSFFPDYVEQPDENMKKMRVKHLLTMSTGHEPANADFIFRFADPVRAFLASEVQKEPGTRFVYNTGATYMLSAIVSKLTGKPVLDYLQEKLFEPLGISGIDWEHCPLGHSLGGVGLNVKTEDIAKLGLFLLQKGNWNGKQLLDPEWIETASARHISNDNATETPWLDSADDVPSDTVPTDWNRGYGFQFWRCIPEHVYRGDGAFGQYCIVMPDQDAVLAITAGTCDMQAILTQIWTILLPAMQAAPLEPNDAEQTALMQTLRSRRIPMPSAGKPSHAIHPNRTYQLEENELGIQRIAFRLSTDARDALILTTKGRDVTIHPGRGAWHEQHFDVETACAFPFRMAAPYADLAFSGAWVDPDCYELRIVCTRAAYVRTVRFSFAQDRLNILYRQNVACPSEGLSVRGFVL